MSALYASDSLDHNIGFENGLGVSVLGSAEASVAIGCNDWFGGPAGQPGPTDLFADPQFCNVAMDSVTLHADSPMLGSSCGLIGAMGQGCGTGSTAVLLSLFDAVAFDGGIRVQWETSGDPVESARIERSSNSAGPWATVTEMAGTSRGEFIDRGVDSEATYFYRLIVKAQSGEETTFGPISSVAEGAMQLAIRPIAPNPARKAVNIAFDLPAEGNVRLSLFDVQGREVALIASGPHAAGHHLANWARDVASGTYFVRLQFGSAIRSREVVVLR